MLEFLSMEQLLPFFFVLAVIYGALEVSGVFKNKGVNSIISVVIALFAIISPGVPEFIYQILPYAVVIFVIVFFIGFLKSFFGGKGDKNKDYTLPVIIIGLVIVFLASMGETLKYRAPELGFLNNENFIVITIIAVMLTALYATYKNGS